MTDQEFISANFINRSPLRLTKKGISIAKTFDLFEYRYKTTIPPHFKITPRRLTWFLKRTDFPFYLDPAWLYTFDKKVIAHLGLAEGDVTVFFPK